MARTVALKLQSQSALAVVVRSSSRSIEVEAVVPIELAEGDSAKSVGEKIAAALAPFSAGRLATVVAVPRSELHWANYDLPPAPDADLPDLVQLQAARDLVLAEDGVGFDYVSLHGDLEHPHRVLGVGVSPAQLERIRGACAGAELKLQRLVPEPLGWLELSRRIAEEPGAPAASISVFAALAGRQAAVWATQDGALRLVRTVWLPAEPDAAADMASLAGELRRTLLSLSQMANAPSSTLPCVYCGENAVNIARQLSESLSRPVRGVRLEDVVEAPSDDLSEVAPLAALAASMAENRQSPVDMLHPHRPPAPPSRRRMYILAGVAAACIAAIVGWTAYRNVRGPFEQAAADDAARLKLDPALKKFEAVEAQTAAVDKWLADSRNLLTELDYLGQQLRPKALNDKEFNSGQDLVLTKLALSGRKLTVEGAARSTDALAPIELRLREARYRVARGVLEAKSEATPGYAAHVSAILERDNDLDVATTTAIGSAAATAANKDAAKPKDSATADASTSTAASGTTTKPAAEADGKTGDAAAAEVEGAATGASLTPVPSTNVQPTIVAPATGDGAAYAPAGAYPVPLDASGASATYTAPAAAPASDEPAVLEAVDDPFSDSASEPAAEGSP